MDVTELPQDIYYNIALSMDYPQLMGNRTISKMFANFCHSDTFWGAKIMKDFRISIALYDKLVQDYNNTGQQLYIHLAAISDPPVIIPGVEEYLSETDLLRVADTLSYVSKKMLLYLCTNMDIITYHIPLEKYIQIYGFDELDLDTMFSSGFKYNMLWHIGIGVVNNGSMELLSKYFEFIDSPELQTDHISNIFILIVTSNNYEMFKYMMLHYSKYIPYIEAIHTAAKNGNLRMMNELLSCYEITEVNKLLRSAATSGNSDVINAVLSMGVTDYNYGLLGASQAGNLEWVQYFISNGATKFDAAFSKSIESGNVELAKLLIKYVPAIKNVENLIYNAININNIPMVEYLLTLAPEELEHVIELSICGKKRQIFKNFIGRSTTNRYDTYMDIAFEVGADSDIVIYLLQYSVNSIKECFLSNLLNLNVLRYLYDNHLDLITEWMTNDVKK